MADRSFLSWPFFEAKHRDFAARLSAFGKAKVEPLAHDEHDADATTKNFVSMLAAEKFLDAAVPDGSHDVRTLCLARETLAYHSGLADFAFAMQGLGTGSIVLFGSPEQKAKWLPAVRAGKSLGAFAMSEPEGGSDVAALRTTATKDGDGWRLNGRKTWISNGGIAGQYVVFARSGEAPGAKGLSAFVVPADAPSLIVEARIDVSAPHPLATLRFENCRVGADALLGKPGDGFKIAMSTLDVFRSTVGAAALGFARRALDEAIAFSKSRKVFGAMLSDMQLTQAALAEAATEIDAAALLIYRAAWTKDSGAPRITREASMAKFFATEMAQRVVDRAVQLHGGQGVVAGATVERLYREVRALRIYEGATEIQKLVIASQILSEPQP
ncbi:MAG: acyl-CoA dehydrogenase family protein [Alphaproteobacteria bacterium]|nr:acyl-CoA dehydrogenase family protein [Alphaproteobacteria bacterium]